MYASQNLIAQYGIDRVREELVDHHWLRAGMTPPGYYKVRTNPLNDEYVLVKAESQEEAVNKYLRRQAQKMSRNAP